MPAYEFRNIKPSDIEYLRNVRIDDPTAIRNAYARRVRPPRLQSSNRSFIIAADHPARGSLSVGSSRMAMADRFELLDRLATAIQHPGVTGVLGTPDILDDLVLLGYLDNVHVIGSMNRGGLSGSVFEFDDRFTAHNVSAIIRDGLDFVKLLIRVALHDPRTAQTLESVANAVTSCAEAGIPIMLEPFMSQHVDGHVVHDLRTDAVIKSIAIASALGNSSSHTWLKVPVVEDMERVQEATSLPLFILGGDRSDKPDEIYSQWEKALKLPSVRGMVVGRSILYPHDGDLPSALDIVSNLIGTCKKEIEGDLMANR